MLQEVAATDAHDTYCGKLLQVSIACLNIATLFIQALQSRRRIPGQESSTVHSSEDNPGIEQHSCLGKHPNIDQDSDAGDFDASSQPSQKRPRALRQNESSPRHYNFTPNEEEDPPSPHPQFHPTPATTIPSLSMDQLPLADLGFDETSFYDGMQALGDDVMWGGEDIFTALQMSYDS